MRILTCVFTMAATAANGRAQGTPSKADIPIWHVAAPDATAKEPLKLMGGLKQFADGRVLVDDSPNKRLIVFDRSLSSFTVTADTTGRKGTGVYPAPIGGVFSYLGDSALVADARAQLFLMVGPDGKLGRAVAPVHPGDVGLLAQRYAGSPGFDHKGRLVVQKPVPFRGGPPAPTPPPGSPSAKTRDTSWIVRMDFDSRTTDSIAMVTTPRPPFQMSDVKRDAEGWPLSAHYIINPVPMAADEWAVLTDGSIAIVRAIDYHIDWVYADGKAASTPRMPFDWRRLTDADKQARLDSVQHVLDSMAATGHPYGGLMVTSSPQRPKPDTVIATTEFVPFSEMLDYASPIRVGAVKADRDNHLWILPTTTLSARGGGLLYDVVNTQGVVFERVQLPLGRALAGFGPNGVIYMTTGDRAKGFILERTHVVRDPTKR